MEPASGRSSPATARSTVLLPEPDAPKTIVTPAGASNVALSAKAGDSRVVIETERLMTAMRAARLPTASASARRRMRERRGNRLHGKRKTVKNGGKHKRLKGEGEAVSGPAFPQSADWAARTDREQHVEAEHRRWQHERHRDDGLNEKYRPPTREREPVGERQRDDEQDDGDERRQSQGQGDRGPVHESSARCASAGRPEPGIGELVDDVGPLEIVDEGGDRVFVPRRSKHDRALLDRRIERRGHL